MTYKMRCSISTTDTHPNGWPTPILFFVGFCLFPGLFHGFCHFAWCRHDIVIKLWSDTQFLLPASIVPIIDETSILYGLCSRIGQVASKEEIIAGLYTPCWMCTLAYGHLNSESLTKTHEDHPKIKAGGSQRNETRLGMSRLTSNMPMQ